MTAIETQAFTLTAEDAGQRLDKILAERLPQLSRVQLQQYIKDGFITVNDESAKPGHKLRGTETIRIEVPEAEDTAPQAEAIDLKVLYEDKHLAVIEKPAGMVVHPGAGTAGGTLVNALLARYPEIAQLDGEEQRQGIVHRLDKDTSGLMVIARTQTALAHLMKQFQNRNVQKAYIALLERTPQTATGRIEAPIARDPQQRKRMAVVRDGKPAITEFTIIDTEFRENQALVELNILTGRTHQIRVHMAFIGCPVVGDTIYGFRKQRVGMKRHFLHAAKLAFKHPQTGETLAFTSELPIGLQEVLKKLR